MGVVDSDTHVDETEATWEHIGGDDNKALRPKTLPQEADKTPGRPMSCGWEISGKRFPGLARSDTARAAFSTNGAHSRMRLVLSLSLGPEIPIAATAAPRRSKIGAARPCTLSLHSPRFTA